MNVMSMMALAMNPNVTPEFFAEQMKKDGERKEAMFQKVYEACEEDPANAMEILSMSLPYLLNS